MTELVRLNRSRLHSTLRTASHKTWSLSEPLNLSFLKGLGTSQLSARSYCASQDRELSELRHSQPKESTRRTLHIPVMKDEVLQILNPQSGQVFLDMTFGAGGHTQSILETYPGVKVIALDRDPLAYRIGTELQKYYGDRLIPVQGRFSEVEDLLRDIGIEESSLDGALFDCGVSSMQFETAKRGFSLVRDGPLDMRMDWNRDPAKPTAADVVNHLNQQGLYEILKKYGEEKKARVIAQAIIDARYTYGKFKTTKELAQVVESVFMEGAYRKDKLMRHAHVATKTFQALRIFVNDELNELYNGLEQVYKLLKPGTGRCVAISFHSLEDRIIKRHFHGIDIDTDKNMTVSDQMRLRSYGVSHSWDEMADIVESKWTPLSKRISLASELEVHQNPRSRSAKLRAAIKTS
ncbi:12S rRNA N4-methylcytidine methyltransferase-like isoform X2 [Lineus longissimus]